MHVREARLPRGGVTQMPHIHLSRKGEHALGIAGVVQLFFRKVFKVALHRAEYLGDGSRTERPFAKHIFLAGVRFQFHTSQSGAFLPPVVLFLHEKIELVQPVHPCTVLFFVISSVKGKRIICFTHTHHPLPVIPPLPTWQDYAVGLHPCLYIRLCDKRAVAREP